MYIPLDDIIFSLFSLNVIWWELFNGAVNLIWIFSLSISHFLRYLLLMMCMYLPRGHQPAMNDQIIFTTTLCLKSKKVMTLCLGDGYDDGNNEKHMVLYALCEENTIFFNIIEWNLCQIIVRREFLYLSTRSPPLDLCNLWNPLWAKNRRKDYSWKYLNFYLY